MAVTNPYFFNRYLEIPPGDKVPDEVNAIIEIPKGTRNKFEIHKDFGLIMLDRYLYSSLFYPGDYGIIPKTLAEDGDPLDIIVMVNEATFSGCLIPARPIGLFKMTDRGDNDFKVLAVPASDPLFADYYDIWRVPPHFLREVEHFFATYKQLEDTSVQTFGWFPASEARDEIISSLARYEENKAKEAELEAEAVKKKSASTRTKKKSTKKATRKATAKKSTKKAAKKTTRKKAARRK